MRSEKITGLMQLGYTYDAAEEMLDMMEEPKPTKVMPVETWTRSVGYFRPVSQMNPGKREEVGERKMFNFKGTFKGVD